MTFAEFEKKANNSLARYMKNLDTNNLYIQLILGLYEEAGEVIAPIRKTIKGNYHQLPIDKKHLAEEIGDVLWYIAQISTQLPGVDLEQIAKNNLRKTHIIYQPEANQIDSIDIYSYSKSVPATYKAELPTETDEKATYFALGLAKEVGEISRLFGEYGIDNNRLDIYKVQEKLGDSLWYLTAICNTYDISLEKVAKDNISKVGQRYDAKGIAITEKEQYDR